MADSKICGRMEWQFTEIQVRFARLLLKTVGVLVSDLKTYDWLQRAAGIEIQGIRCP